MMYTSVPSFYSYNNGGITPVVTESKNPELKRFFQRYLLQRAMSVFKWELPDGWPHDYFLYTLYCNGFIAVINTDLFGVIPQSCGLSGFDVYYRPTKAVITNPLLRGIVTPAINRECALIKLQLDYGGIMDIVSYYADLMSTAAATCGVNLHNSKLSYIFTAKNKASADTLKKLYERVARGEPMTVVDKDLFATDGSPAWSAFEQNVGQNYIVDKLLSDLRRLENMFDTTIGIPNANTDKKERMIVDEVNANNVETTTLCEMWLDEIKRGSDKARELFGVKIDVDWRNLPKKEGGVKNDVA